MNYCMVLFVALLGWTAASRSVSDASKSPISRIVGLLNGLKGKLEEDLKAEQELYETYRCWYKTTVDTKTASNKAADSRIESLTAYIADIEAGRIEFTTERVDLEKQISELKHDLETAKAMRDSEHKDFVAAETEMKQAVAALDEAITQIEGGTSEKSLAQTRSYAAMLATRHSIQKSMAFARGFLSAEEQKYLEHVLSDDEPKDWKKLNRKATYKMKYKAASGKILSTLKKLKTQFENNLKDARDQEAEAQANYEKLEQSKTGMLDKSNQALTDMVEEGAARGLSKTQAQNEVDALKDQKTADEKFIAEAETAFTTKEQQWKAREEMRNKEILAMSQAIAVLASDDAKDQFTKSFASQGYTFLQELKTESDSKRRVKCAARLVHSMASKSRDPRLSLLELKAKSGNEAIDEVIKKIDEIVAELEEEEGTDLDKKQTCESDLAEAAAGARSAALDIDTATEDIRRTQSEIEELTVQIKEQEEKITGLNGQMKEITRQREDENTKYKADKVDDENAIALVEQALNIIKEWKSAEVAPPPSFEQTKVTPKATAPTPPEGIMPASWHPPAKAVQPLHRMAAAAIKVHTNQKASAKQNPEFQVEAGEAPPPPPPTWDTGATYEGAAGEQKGIVGILTLVKGDMEKDIASATKDEEQAVTDYEKAHADLEGEVKACEETITAYKADKADKDKTLTAKTEERSGKKDELDSKAAEYKGYKPGCDFLLVNFNIRSKARTQEIDGLKKAKAVLQGADFGGSFLQGSC